MDLLFVLLQKKELIALKIHLQPFQYEVFEHVEPLLSKIISHVEPDLPQATQKALHEVNALLKNKMVEVDDVAKMSDFSSLFGREQCFLSLINEQSNYNFRKFSLRS